jgi:hypothetical protein
MQLLWERFSRYQRCGVAVTLMVSIALEGDYIIEKVLNFDLRKSTRAKSMAKASFCSSDNRTFF